MFRAVGFSALCASLLALAACGGDGKATPAAVAATTVPAIGAATATPAPSQAGGAPRPIATPTKALKDPCSYVTKDEIQTATGKSLTSDGIKVNDFSCRWPTADSGTVNIFVGSPVAKDRFEDSVKAAVGASPTAIPGLGDEAFEIFSGVAVYKGNTSINVVVSPSTEQKGGAAAIALARLILTRI